LFLIEQDRLDEALALYVTQVWGVSPDDSQDQVSAVSLRARLELAGAHVGPRGQPLADRLAARIDDHVEPFLDMHCLYGLARAGRPGADRMMASVEAFAAAAPPASHEAWARVCVPACRGLLAHARGDHGATLSGLGEALPRMTAIGGSHAQHDLFAQMHVDAMLHTGRWSAAQNVLQPLAKAQPASRRLAGMLRRVYGAPGLGGAIGV